jgi:uncharacterized membrane protein YozB (DUF420 family)
MTGFFGTKASLLSDISLILETIIVAGIMYAWWLGKKHKSSNHHWIMLVMVVVDFGFLAVYMVHRAIDPAATIAPGPFYQYVYLPTVLVHSFISSIAFVWGLVLSIRGIRHHVKDSKPGTYVMDADYLRKHRRQGVWAAWSYLISALTGIAVYYMLYMM